MDINFTLNLWLAVPVIATAAIIALLAVKFTGPYHGDYNFGGAIDGLVWIMGILLIAVIWLSYFLVV